MGDSMFLYRVSRTATYLTVMKLEYRFYKNRFEVVLKEQVRF